MLSYILFRLAGIVVPWVPRRLGYAAMRLGAALMYTLSEGKRRMIRRNVRVALGAGAAEQQIDRVARRIFYNLFKNYFDLFWLPRQPVAVAERLITVRNPERLQAALAAGRGVIAVAAHIGNQELMTQARVITEVPVTAVAEHIKPERLYRYILTLRQATGTVHLVTVDGALREIFRALKRNEVVGLAVDRDVTESGRLVPFFGLPTRMPDGYAVLGLKLRPVLMPVFIIRRPDDGFDLFMEELIFPEGSSTSDDDVRNLMSRVLAVFERYVERYTDQWVYFHDVWPTTTSKEEQSKREYTEQATA